MPGEARLDDLRAMHEALGVERVATAAASARRHRQRRPDRRAAPPRRRGPRRRPARPRRARGLLPRRDARGRGPRRADESREVGADDPEVAAPVLRVTAGRRRLRRHVDLHAGLDVVAALKDTIATLPAPTVVDHFGFADPADGPAHRLRRPARPRRVGRAVREAQRARADRGRPRWRPRRRAGARAPGRRARPDAVGQRLAALRRWPARRGAGPGPRRAVPHRGRRARARTPARLDAPRRRGPPRAGHEPRAARGF